MKGDNWMRGVLALIAVLSLDGAVAIAYLTSDEKNLTLLIGALIVNAGSAFGYYLGSSASSSRKTELLGPQPPTTGPTP